MPGGIKVEVKSSAFVQSWKQKKPSTPRFSIKKSLPTWDYCSKTKNRHADVYVFCLLKHKDKATINPIDASQWEFYLIRTDELEKDLPDARSISLKSVQSRSSIHRVQDLLEGIHSLMSANG